MSYRDFARFYDRLTENIDYREFAEPYLKALCSFKTPKGGSLLDLACGSGSFSVIMEEHGYIVTGADLSEGMLTAAAAKSHGIRWLRLDMTSLPFDSEFDSVICCLDSINHLEDLDEIQKTFSGVYRSLKKGGLFLADLNTPFKHKKVLADNAFVFDYEGLFCSWQNELDPHCPLCRVDMFLDFFEENKNGSYTRYTDSLSEIAPDPEEIVQMLAESGFSVKSVTDFPSGKKLSPKSEKYMVAALKE